MKSFLQRLFFIRLFVFIAIKTTCMNPVTIELPPDMWNKIIAGSENEEKNMLAKCCTLLHLLSHKNNHSLYIHTPLILNEHQKKYALLCATYHANAQAVKNLLSHDARPHSSTIYLTLLPYSWAYQKKNKMIMHTLREYDEKNNHHYYYSKTIPRLYAIAAYLGDLHTLQECAQKNNYDPYYNNNYGNSLLHAAVLNGHYHITEWLLRDPRIVNTASYMGWEGKSALLMATEKKYANIVELLLKVPTINVNNRSLRGMTPLHAATIRHYYSIVQLLLHHPDIDVNLQVHNGYTALHIATENEDIDMIKIIVAPHKCNFYIANNAGETVFDLARRVQNRKIQRLLRDNAKKSFYTTKIAMWQNK